MARKHIYVAISCVVAICICSIYLLSFPNAGCKTELDVCDKSLTNQELIEKISERRPKIYLYSDFGNNSGNNKDSGRKGLCDLQTSQEIASLVWKVAMQLEMRVNDSAKPLSPLDASLLLAKTFPYQKCPSRIIVVHVIDPGVGNSANTVCPRCVIIRKDGVVFIGPDNGTASLACPADSIQRIYQIDNEKLNQFSGVDTNAGGTFHGRDVFMIAAILIAAGTVTPEQIGSEYGSLQNRFDGVNSEEVVKELAPIDFVSLRTDRFVFDANMSDQIDVFQKAFFLGMIQCGLYPEGKEHFLTQAKKIFVCERYFPETIGIINVQTNNIFIGPNNGVGVSFFEGYPSEKIKIVEVSRDLYNRTMGHTHSKDMANNELLYRRLDRSKVFEGKVEGFVFPGQGLKVTGENSAVVEAQIWIDAYGNIKTTMKSSVLEDVKKRYKGGFAMVNGVQKPIIFAETFSQVKEKQLFVYSGSTACIGPNPRRSERYVELATNGIYGKFGVDLFVNKSGNGPKTGQTVIFTFFK